MRYYEPSAERIENFDPTAVATATIESGSDALLLDAPSLPPAFYDLSTRVAGELLHQLSKYGVRLAAVVTDLDSRSGPFRDFVREANRGGRSRFFETRGQAIAWLEGEGSAGKSG